jgi:hypothetical protein
MLGLAFQRRLPDVVAVRVSPWPVTSPLRIAGLARRTARLLARVSAEPRFEFSFAELRSGLRLDPRFIGAGYGRVTPDGLAAIRRFGAFGTALDTTYSAKSAAGFLRSLQEHRGPTLYWATKSSRPLPATDPERLRELPASARRWLALCGSEGRTAEDIAAEDIAAEHIAAEDIAAKDNSAGGNSAERSRFE